MDKSNFKKMALMGMAAGTLLSAQSPVNAAVVENVQSMVVAKGCGGGNCSAKPRQSYTADATPSYTQQSCSQRPRQGNTADATPYTQQMQPNQQNAGQRYGALSETEFQSQLNDEGKAIFRGLDAEGKALALRLAQEDQHKDKNQIVRMAAQKSAEKRAGRPGDSNGYGY